MYRHCLYYIFMVVKVLFSSEMTRICIGCGVVKIERQGSNLEEAPYSIGQSCRLIARIEGVPVTYGSCTWSQRVTLQQADCVLMSYGLQWRPNFMPGTSYLT